MTSWDEQALYEVGGITAVVVSPLMRQLLDRVERVAKSPANVLIVGESGSGKELIARTLHAQSLRCHKPWVDINCGALPDHLVESELFGYEKGAFSGADSAKPGLLELANGGTLFLDEISELSTRAQVKLLRVLDGVPYYRLGGTKKVSVDVRIVAATNQNLEEAMRTRQFRSDLYYRLAQVNLKVPPLRECPEDVVPMAEFFLHSQDPKLCLASDVGRLLRRHSWPGNIRELRNLVTQAAILAREHEVRACDFPAEIYAAPQRATELAPPPMLEQAPEPISDAATSSLAGIERQAILRVLEQTYGDRGRTADLLGISRRTLSRKLKAYVEPARGAQIATPILS